ncbi:MAG: CopG family transcriptional regulator [Pirellulaceae bacterium]
MATLTIYLDDDTLAAIERAAREEGSSISAWARKHLAEASRETATWPHGYLEEIAAFGGTHIEEPKEVEVPLDDISLDLPSND